MNIILFGPPGAGKGTQGDVLVKNYNLHKVSTGDLLREEIKTESILGKKIKTIIDKGHLVSDDITNNLVETLISNLDYKNRLVFDGYPRNLNQAKHLDLLIGKYNQKISCVLNLKIEKANLIKRIIGRQICSKCHSIFNEYFNQPTKENHTCDPKYLQKRSDDNEEILKSRFETYSKETMPILNHYKKQKILYEINGMNEIAQIYKEIQQIMLSLET